MQANRRNKEMKIDKNKITVARFIKVPYDKCEKMVLSYFQSLTSDSEGGTSAEYKPKYFYRKEDTYRDNPLCKECFQLHNIKK